MHRARGGAGSGRLHGGGEGLRGRGRPAGPGPHARRSGTRRQRGGHHPRLDRRHDRASARLEGWRPAGRPLRGRREALLDRSEQRRSIRGQALARAGGADPAARGLPDGRLSHAAQLRLPRLGLRSHPQERHDRRARRGPGLPREGLAPGALPAAEERRRGDMEPPVHLLRRGQGRALRPHGSDEARRHDPDTDDAHLPHPHVQSEGADLRGGAGPLGLGFAGADRAAAPGRPGRPGSRDGERAAPRLAL